MIALGILCLSAVVATAQTDTSRSRDAAQEVIGLLSIGDRIAALAAAVHALPDDPSQSGRDRLTALWRAVHARPFMLDDDRPYSAAVDPSGSRLLLTSAEGFTGDLASHAPGRLIDLTTGEPLGEAIPAPEIDSEMMQRQSHSIGFSPDGRFASVMLMSRDAVILLDARDGRRHATLEMPGPDFGMTTLIFPVGFSPDSTRFAAGSPLGLFVWDTASGQVKDQVPFAMDAGRMVMPMAWGPDDALYGLRSDQSTAAELIVIKNGTIHVLSIGLSPASHRMRVSPDGKAIAVDNLASTELFDIEGNHTGSIPPSASGRFVRGGAAYAVSNLQEVQSVAAMSVRVFGLDGQELAPEPSDYGGFDHHVFSKDGKLLGTSIWGTAVTYLGDANDTADGLVRAARALVPAGYETPAVAAAAPSEDALPDAVLSSRQFARTADDRLSTGDRVGAILAALKGLPADPADADFERFEQAHVMLFRAVASRNLRADLAFPAGATVDPTGQRMAVAGYNTGMKAGSVRLLDTRNGDTVADLALPDGTSVLVHPSNHTPHFSPGGAVLAIVPATGGQIHLFDGQSGAYIRPLTMPGATDTPSYGLADVGFSPEGARYAAVSDGSLYVFDVATGDLRLQEALPSRYGFVPTGWGSRGEIYFGSMPTSSDSEAEILRFENVAFEKHFDVLDASGRPANSVVFSEVSIHSSAMWTLTQDMVWTVYDADGAKVSEIRAPDTPLFLRGGTALGYWTDEAGTGKTLRVQDLSGSVLQPELEDYVPFDQRLFDLSGSAMTFGSPRASAAIWRAKDHLRGRDLYDLVWQSLPQDLRTEVSDERVVRAD